MILQALGQGICSTSLSQQLVHLLAATPSIANSSSSRSSSKCTQHGFSGACTAHAAASLA
eukprot:21231-Heterococcus_DN1.PRE.12